VFLALVNLLIVSASTYLVVRAVLMAMGGQPLVSTLLGALLLLAEGFLVFQSVAYALDVAGPLRSPPVEAELATDWNDAPAVAVLMPARHEPREVIEDTLTCLENLDYPNKTIYFLDDSTDEPYKVEAKELAEDHRAVLFRREVRHGAKAGVLNDRIKGLEEKYVAVFDSDQRPVPGFLKEVIPLLEANDRLAFVQTPQFYSNTAESPVAFAANLQHCIFYEHICEGKDAARAMMCCGTNMVLRREALLDVGGFDEFSVTEDFSTSLDFVSRGWQTKYHRRVCAFGQGPESLIPYLTQQWRWSRGNLGVLRKILRYLITRPFSMRPRQWWEFLSTGSYYLIGWAYFILMVCPILFILFRVPSFFMEPAAYLLTFVPYFSLSLTIFFTSMQERHYRPMGLFGALLLGFTAIPIYMRAAIGAFLNFKAPFSVTAKVAERQTPPLRLFWAQTALWLMNLVGLVWGVNYVLVDFNWPVLMCTAWVFYHFLLLSGVFHFRGAKERLPDVAAEPA